MGNFDLDPVTIFQLVSVAEPNVSSDLNDVERPATKILHGTMLTETDPPYSCASRRMTSSGSEYGRVSSTLRMPGYKRMPVFCSYTAQPFDPDGEISKTADDPASKAQHVFRNSRDGALLAFGLVRAEDAIGDSTPMRNRDSGRTVL